MSKPADAAVDGITAALGDTESASEWAHRNHDANHAEPFDFCPAAVCILERKRAAAREAS